MNNKEFSNSMEIQYARCKELLCTKQAEYTPDKDVFEVFKKASTLCGEGGVKSAIFDFMLKHIVSISDMCHTDDKFALDRWNEKLTDAMNYLFLLKAYIEEENNVGKDEDRCGEDCSHCAFVDDCTLREFVEGSEYSDDCCHCDICNDCIYSECDGSDEAFIDCKNNCVGCAHHVCTRESEREEPLDLTHLVQEATDKDYEEFWESVGYSIPIYDTKLSQEIEVAKALYDDLK